MRFPQQRASITSTLKGLLQNNSARCASSRHPGEGRDATSPQHDRTYRQAVLFV